MAALFIHHVIPHRSRFGTAILPHMVLNHLMLHPVLVDAFGAGLRGALIAVANNRVCVLNLHLEHASLVFVCG